MFVSIEMKKQNKMDDYFKADVYGFLSVYLPRVLTGVFYYAVGLFSMPIQTTI